MKNIKTIHMEKERIEGVFDCACACFFIAEKTRDEAFIENLATKLIGEGCRRFTFFGKHRILWENIFDDVDIKLNPHCGYEDVSVTMTDKYVETFADGIIAEFKPQVYLFYDDEERQKEVLELVEKEQSREDDTKRYMLSYEGTEDMFYRICKEFEKKYPDFEKEELLVDPLDGELIQRYTKGDKKATIIFERVFDEWIAGYANFDLENFRKSLEILHLCPCCKNGIIEGSFEECPVCNWVYDVVQEKYPNAKKLGNIMSLNEAKRAYKKGQKIY